jgi:hypothetical protein
MITLPQVFGWFSFWGVGAPLPGGGIGNGWMSTFSNDATIFVNTLVIGRLVPVLAAWMAVRSKYLVRQKNSWVDSGSGNLPSE